MSKQIYIVDDEPALRDAMTLMLQQDGFSVESFESAEAFLNKCDLAITGCVIADVRMPGMDGLQLQMEMHQRDILLPIIFLTGHGDIPMSVNAIKEGAVDFLTKPVTRSKLLTSIEAAFELFEKTQKKFLRRKEARRLLKFLTEREYEVLLLAVSGLSNKEIARKLGISHRTVEIHRTKIMLKTGTSNLLELVRMAQDAEVGAFETSQ